MKTWEMMKVMEDENTPIGTEFTRKIPCGDVFRIIKTQWNNGEKISFALDMFRGERGIIDSDAIFRNNCDWTQIEKVKKVTVKEIEELFGCKVEIVE